MVNSDRVVVVTDLKDGSKLKDLTQFFDQVGKVKQSILCDNLVFIEYSESKDAARAVVNLDGRTFEGETLLVQLPTVSHIQLLESNKEGGGDPHQDEVVAETLGLLGKLSLEQRNAVVAALTGSSPPPTQDVPPVPPYFIPPPTLFATHVPHLPTFSGNVTKGEVSFQRWKYEVKCLKKSALQENIILQAIRRSLRSTPADVLTWMGESATVDDILHKLEGLYGTVLSGEALIQKFYSERMLPDESVTSWGCRLEEILSQAVALGKVEPPSMNGMLKAKFWSDLSDDRLKNATRHKVDMIDSFTQLCMEVRAVEQELKERDGKRSSKPVRQGQSQAIQESTNKKGDGKQDELLAMIRSLTQKVDRLEEKVNNQRRLPLDNPRVHQIQPRPTDSSVKGEIVCFRCGHTGHVKQGCRVKKENFKVRPDKAGEKNPLNRM